MSAVPADADSDTVTSPLYGLIDAAAQRLQTADPVAATKWLNGGSISDPARVQQVLAGVSADAESLGIPADFVARQFTNQIDATEAVEYGRFSQWKFDPSAAPTSAPDLAASRSVIDQLNHQIVGEIAGQWPVLHSVDCPAQLTAAKSGVADARGLEPIYRQALDAATRSYCG